MMRCYFLWYVLSLRLTQKIIPTLPTMTFTLSSNSITVRGMCVYANVGRQSASLCVCTGLSRITATPLTVCFSAEPHNTGYTTSYHLCQSHLKNFTRTCVCICPLTLLRSALPSQNLPNRGLNPSHPPSGSLERPPKTFIMHLERVHNAAACFVCNLSKLSPPALFILAALSSLLQIQTSYHLSHPGTHRLPMSQRPGRRSVQTLLHYDSQRPPPLRKKHVTPCLFFLKGTYRSTLTSSHLIISPYMLSLKSTFLTSYSLGCNFLW